MKYSLGNILLNCIAILFVLSPIVFILGPASVNIMNTFIPILIIIYFFYKKNIYDFSNIYLIIFLIWSFYLILVSILSNNYILSLEATLFHFRFAFLVLGIYILLRKKNIYLKYFTYFLNFIFIFLIFDAFIQFIFGINIFGLSLEDDRRLSGVFGEEYILGSYLARFMPMLIGLNIYLNNPSKKLNYYNLFLILIVIITIFISGERTAFFFAILTLFFSFILIDSLRKELIASSLISIILIIFVSFYNQGPKTRIFNETIASMQLFKYDINDNITSINSFSLNDDKGIVIFSKQHENHYKSALKMFTNNYLIGVGPKNFRIECQKIKYFVEEGCSTHPHNTYVQLLSETGIIGFTFIFVIFLFVVKNILFLLIKKCENIKRKEVKACFMITFLISLWPIAPSGSFFSSFIFTIYILPLGIYLHILENLDEKKY